MVRESMSKDNRYYLEKMQENIEFILEHMDGVSKTDLENDPVLLDSMILLLFHCLSIGKGLTHLLAENTIGLRRRII